MFDPDKDGIYARITVSFVRFYAALCMQAALGLLLLYVGFSTQAGPVGKFILIAFGVLALAQAVRQRNAAKREILLTDQGMVTDDGLMLAEMDQMVSISRGAFALKPSNGFSVVLKDKHGFLWVPGLWWRFGHRVGIGGVTGAGAAKFMAEQIALRIATRDL